MGDNELNQGVWTTMSYNNGYKETPVLILGSYGYQASPMAFDIAAIQYLYGANYSFHNGPDTYVLPSSNTSGTSYTSIWDTAGIDTISADVLVINSATIDLREAPLTGANAGGYISYANIKDPGFFWDSEKRISGGFTIANGVRIENAIGSPGKDKIIGNDLNNDLSGKSGDDILYGGKGNDTLNGESGTNILNGGEGNDVLVGGADLLLGNQGAYNGNNEFQFKNAGEGVDTILRFGWGDIIKVDSEGFGIPSYSSPKVITKGDWWWDTTTTPTFLITPDLANNTGTLSYYAQGTQCSCDVTIANFENTYWNTLYSSWSGLNWMVSASNSTITSHDEL
jgi:serralysin